MVSQSHHSDFERKGTINHKRNNFVSLTTRLKFLEQVFKYDAEKCDSKLPIYLCISAYSTSQPIATNWRFHGCICAVPHTNMCQHTTCNKRVKEHLSAPIFNNFCQKCSKMLPKLPTHYKKKSHLLDHGADYRIEF